MTADGQTAGRTGSNAGAQTATNAAAKPDLSVRIGSLGLKNPVVAAYGVFGYGLELAAFCPPERLGAIIVKGLAAEPWPGNPGPRVVEAADGLLNSVGLENMGAAAFLGSVLPLLKARGAMAGANLVGRAIGEYERAASMMAESEIDFLELNISCPNLSGEGGLSFGADPDLAARLTRAAVKAARGKPMWVKLPPLVSDMASLAAAVEGAGASALSLVNTLPGLAVDLETRRPRLGRGPGGLSGPPLKPLALRQVWTAARAVSIPVVGLGGIMGAIDALEFMAAGASAVQLGTAILVDPASPLAVIDGISAWLEARSLPDLASVTGSLVMPEPARRG
jgi:dihydroorotate dehydrogenase (NAD+) catalytic subunit